MKKFIFKVCTFCGIFTISAFCLICFDYFVIGNQHLGNYEASLIDKFERLQSINEPKIILIGNSNVCFGINSEKIEEAFGMPVVDMGLHGGLGNAFLENMVKLGVSEGDIVIVCHSSFGDDDTIPDTALAWITIEMHKDLWSLIRMKDWLSMARSYPDYFKNSIIYWHNGSKDNIPNDETCYSRSAFNKYGDIEKRSNNTYIFESGDVTVPIITDVCINRMNRLNKYVERHGATLLVAGYPIGAGEFTPSPELFDKYEAELREKLDCEVISHYRDYFIPYDLFYNTQLHLSKEGADIRTLQLISDIQRWMDYK